MKLTHTITGAALLLLLVASGGCDSKPDPSGNHETAATRNREMTPMATAEAEPQSVDPCAAIAGLPASLESISANASRMLAGPDSCVTRLIDSIGSITGSGDRPAMAALDSLARHADGYASEAISTLMPGIFRRSPETVIRYLIDIRDDRPQALRDALVAGFSLERPTQLDPASQRDLDRRLFALLSNGLSLTPAERPFLDSLRRDCLADSMPR